MISNFNGKDGFIWWVGVVEDRIDPLFLGRCKVRIFAWHTSDKSEIPTDELHWAIPSLPLDQKTAVGPKEGDWVWGFFTDSLYAQEPVMIGKLIGYPERAANPAEGYYDPRTSELFGHQVPRDPAETKQFDDGSGNEYTEIDPKSSYPDVRFLEEAQTSRLERNEKIEETIVQKKKDNIKVGQTDVPVAEHPASGVGTDVESKRDPWTEKETPYNAKYPYNHVYESESGHVIEIDDTPGAERLQRYHRVGTFEEIHTDGTRVAKVVENDYQIVLAERFQHIEHSDHLTIDKAYNVLVNKDGESGKNYTLTVGQGGNLNLTTDAGDMNFFMQNGNWNVKVVGDINVVVEGDANIRVKGNANSVVQGDGNMTIQGNSTIRTDKTASVSVGKDAVLNVGGNCTKYVTGNMMELIMGTATRVVLGTYLETQPIPLPQTVVGQVAAYTSVMNELITSFDGMVQQSTAPSGRSAKEISLDVGEGTDKETIKKVGTQDPAMIVNNTPKDFMGSQLQESFTQARGSGTSSGVVGGASALSSIFGSPALADGFEWKPISDSTGKLAIITDTLGKGKASAIRLIDPITNAVIEENTSGRLSTGSDDPRERFFFEKIGEEYPDGVIVLIMYKEPEKIVIEDTTEHRIDKSIFIPTGPAPSSLWKSPGNGFLWKSQSDGGGGPYARKLVILSKNAIECVIYRAEPNGNGGWQKGKRLAQGKFSNIANGNRRHYRFTKFGREFGPGPVYVDDVFVPDPSKRWE